MLAFCHENYFDDIVGFAKDIIGIELSEQQKLVAEDLVKHKKVVVKSGHKRSVSFRSNASKKTM